MLTIFGVTIVLYFCRVGRLWNYLGTSITMNAPDSDFIIWPDSRIFDLQLCKLINYCYTVWFCPILFLISLVYSFISRATLLWLLLVITHKYMLNIRLFWTCNLISNSIWTTSKPVKLKTAQCGNTNLAVKVEVPLCLNTSKILYLRDFDMFGIILSPCNGMVSGRQYW